MPIWDKQIEADSCDNYLDIHRNIRYPRRKRSRLPASHGTGVWLSANPAAMRRGLRARF